MLELAPDTVVDDRYQIFSRIGSGGMADVYCAQDLQLGRKVALKLLHQRFARDDQFVERFRREASSAAGLQHPNVVGVFDRGQWDGTYYIAMEYLEGSTLKQLSEEIGPMDPEWAVGIVEQVLLAARFAHRRGVIHRDLKPHNVILDEEGRAKVTDFGIARAGSSDMTETGSIMGTAQYLSPEQAQGHPVSEASDVYAIGIILYELLAGQVPFDGDTAVTIALKQVSEAPVPPSVYSPAVPPELDAVVLRALEKDPSHRFADADEFLTALEHVRAGQAVPTGQATAAFGAVGAVESEDATQIAPAADAPVGEVEEADLVGAYPLEPLPPPEERERDRRRWAWILGLVLLLALAGLVWTLTRADKREVPDVVGSQLAAASAVLKNEEFKVDVQRVTNDAPKDRVLREDPQPGTEAEVGSTIELTVSDGPGNTVVPDVEGKPQKEAERLLRKAGFRVRVDQEESDTVAEGAAIRTAPEAGSSLERNSRVTLFVSSGREQVTVPGVVGQDEDDARAELADAGLKADVSREESDRPAGTVLSQSPEAGASVEAGSSVAIVIATESTEVSVPGVVGRTQGAAISTLSGAGLTVVVDEQTVPAGDRTDGRVISQSPGAGSRVDKGSRVTITVARAQSGSDSPDDPGGTPQPGEPTPDTPPDTP